MLAETNFRNQRIRFGIKPDDRRRHMYLLGKTGMGKSTVLENMIIQDIQNGQGLALVDPHGDLAEKILDFIPSHRVNDVIYFNPSDMHYPIAFNVMESVNPEYKHLIASGLVGVFKKLWADSWGPRLEYLLRNAILALLDYPGSTLLGVMRILVDKTYRKKVIAKIQDPVVKAFWVDEFSKYPQQFQVEAIAPIQNKVGQFLSTALTRNVVGQVKSSFDLREVMDKQKILIMNLSKGRIGEDSSALLGAMMITKIQLAAMSRIDIPEHDRKDFYLYVDEFQNFATESFANILSEARKYRLNLIIGHQYIEQLDEIVRAAVFGNVGTLMCFRVGAADGVFLENEFTPYFMPEDLVNLSKYDIYLKLMIDGVASNPFSATTLPPLDDVTYTENRDKIIKVSRERYATAREIVEEKISRWSGVMTEEDIKEKNKEEEAINQELAQQRRKEEGEEGGGENKTERQKISSPINQNSRNGYQGKKPEARSVPVVKSVPQTEAVIKREPQRSQPQQTPPIEKKSAKKEGFEVICYECGKKTTVGFEPDGVRPIYCQDCFKKIRDDLVHERTDDTSANSAIPEISLVEALKKPPIEFERKKNTHTEQKKIEGTTTIEKTKPPVQIVVTENYQLSQPLRPVQPGEVIKF